MKKPTSVSGPKFINVKKRGRIAILYYTFTGYTQKAAYELQQDEGGDVYEVKESQPRTKKDAYLRGCTQAANLEAVPIEPVECDFSQYDFFVLMAPVWGGYPAPALYSMLELLPKGAKIEIIAVSGSGNSSRCREKVCALVNRMGLELHTFSDVKKDIYAHSERGKRRLEKIHAKDAQKAAKKALKEARKQAKKLGLPKPATLEEALQNEELIIDVPPEAIAVIPAANEEEV